MPENNLITDAGLAELRRKWSKCQPGQWRFSEYLDVFRIELSDAFPGLLARLEAAERDRDLMRWLVVQLYDDLPAKRDWLDRDLDRELEQAAQRLREGGE